MNQSIDVTKVYCIVFLSSLSLSWAPNEWAVPGQLLLFCSSDERSSNCMLFLRYSIASSILQTMFDFIYWSNTVRSLQHDKYSFAFLFDFVSNCFRFFFRFLRWTTLKWLTERLLSIICNPFDKCQEQVSTIVISFTSWFLIPLIRIQVLRIFLLGFDCDLILE